MSRNIEQPKTEYTSAGSRGPGHLPVRAAIIVGIVVLVVAGVVFGVGRDLASQYRESTVRNNAVLVSGYGDQMASSVEREIADPWKAADTLASLIGRSADADRDALLRTASAYAGTGEFSQVFFYTEAGFLVDAEGNRSSRPDWMELADQAVRTGRAVRMDGTRACLFEPVQTEQSLEGSRICAIGIVRDFSTLLDPVDLTSFGGTVRACVCQTDGVIIARSAGMPAEADHIDSVLSSGSFRSLTGSAAGLPDALTADQSAVFLYEDTGAEDLYVAVVPVIQDPIRWTLIVTVPAAQVNGGLDHFSRLLTGTALGMAGTVILLVLFGVWLFDRQSSRNYEELATREEMLDLLVSGVNCVFSLYAVGKDEPLYTGRQQPLVPGENKRRHLVRNRDGAIQFENTDGTRTPYMDAINVELAGWNGKDIFISSYIRGNIGGKPMYLETRVYPVPERNEYIFMTTDVTAEHDREESLRSALAMADGASRAKSAFLSNMSHDIRTPMNAIVNMTDFALASEDVPEKVRGYLETIKVSSDHLLQLINQVLDMSRIENGTVPAERVPFDLRQLVDETEAIIRPLCQNKGHVLNVCFSVHHTALLGDAAKLSRILMNLLNNAVKFTPEGGTIELTVKESPAMDSRHALIELSVQDNGIGIPKEQQLAVFEPFVRVEDPGAKRIEGTGLGLSICRSYTEAMGGHISLRSELGKGTIFTVMLPFEIDSRSSEAAIGTHDGADLTAAAEQLKDKKVLLCEDNEINQQIATMMLESLGMHVTVAEDGRKGTDVFIASPPGTFDLIFMDVQMPVMNGYEAAQAIRRCGHVQAASIPIIAMTANVFKEDIEKAKEAGMNAHIGKPISRKTVIDTVSHVLASRKAGA